ncbi:MAG: PhzF family phenazine biosynthesis protein [Gemmatimonadales bacterium]
MSLRITQVDAFTSRPFAGNPAAVCILPKAAAPSWMLDVAREMNLAETAFLVRRQDGFDLRWFTPAVEVDLCGHATLASAHVLWEEGHIPPTAQARFHTKSGLLTADLRDSWIELDFPATPATAADPPPGLIEALDDAQPVFVGRSRFDYLVEISGETHVRALTPDLRLLAEVRARGVMVTSRADTGAEYDFVSRFFAPQSGVPEDPVTGSAHCALTPYWAQKLGKRDLIAYQASARGGMLRLRLDADRVKIGGQAVTVLRGELTAGNMAS